MIIIQINLEVCGNTVKIYQPINRNGDIVDFNEPNVTELFSFKRKVTEQRGVDETKDAKITVPWK